MGRVTLTPKVRRFLRDYMVLYASWVLTEPRITPRQIRAARKLFKAAAGMTR